MIGKEGGYELYTIMGGEFDAKDKKLYGVTYSVGGGSEFKRAKLFNSLIERSKFIESFLKGEIDDKR